MDDATRSAPELARAYYRAIDDQGEERLEDLLTTDFVQERSDRTFQGRAAFVRFMREDRPDPDTTHEVRAVFRPVGDEDAPAANSPPTDSSSEQRVAVQGRVRRSDGTPWFEFVDVFTVLDGRIDRLDTYSR